MPNLKDIKDGKVKIGNSTSISFNGKVYRGKTAITELVNSVFPDEPTKKKGGSNARKRRSRKTSAKVEQPAAEPEPAEQQNADEPAAEPSDS